MEDEERHRQGPSLMTLPSIMSMLGHTHDDIDVLKIDIEQQEWPVFKEWMELGLCLPRTLIVELHFGPVRCGAHVGPT